MPLVVNARSRPDPVLALVLCQLRTERGLSPDAVAERAGMTTAAYRQLEGSLTGPSWTTVRSIAEALGVSMGELGAAVDRESTPGELDRKAPESRKHVHRRAMLAVLIFAGLRLAEMLELRWHEVDLPAGWLNVEGTTTDQAVRRIKIRGALHDELLGVRSEASDTSPGAYVFPSSSGERMGTENFRQSRLRRQR